MWRLQEVGLPVEKRGVQMWPLRGADYLQYSGAAGNVKFGSDLAVAVSGTNLVLETQTSEFGQFPIPTCCVWYISYGVVYRRCDHLNKGQLLGHPLG